MRKIINKYEYSLNYYFLKPELLHLASVTHSHLIHFSIFFFPLNGVFLCGSGCPRTLCRPRWPPVERSTGLCLPNAGITGGLL